MGEEVDRFDADSGMTPPFASAGFTYAKVTILRTEPVTHAPPTEESTVYLGGKREAEKGYGLDRIKEENKLRLGLLWNGGTDKPFGLVMIEALACGTPVIAWRNGSVPEVIEDGVTGFVVDSVEEAVKAVRRVDWLDRAVCRQRFAERFNAGRMARDYVDVYRRLVHGNSESIGPVRRAPEPLWLARQFPERRKPTRSYAALLGVLPCGA
jgi:hypothetical protein